MTRRRTSSPKKGFIKKLDEDNIFFLASGLAFNLLICFIPLLLVILSIVGFFFYTSQEALTYVQKYLEKLLPQASSKLTSNILNIVKDRKLVGLIGFVGLFWAASRLFSSVRTVLDKTLEVSWPHGFIKEKLMDLLMVFVTGFLFLFSFILTGLIDLLGSIPEKLGIKAPSRIVFHWWGILVSLLGGYLFSVLMFFFLFRFMPSRRPSNRTAFLASLLVAALWDAAKYIFRLYVNLLNNFTAVYGSLGLLVVFIFWIYYSCLIFVLGGEIVWLQERKR
ncbi:MAG TPA: YihY/virulence factor BrkB family protein [Thermodesulfobacteriota bacterium]|nr:YihY/virulence factor BrkB family protein [Thermodesulfobacteriota bacterium]